MGDAAGKDSPLPQKRKALALPQKVGGFSNAQPVRLFRAGALAGLVLRPNGKCDAKRHEAKPWQRWLFYTGPGVLEVSVCLCLVRL